MNRTSSFDTHSEVVAAATSVIPLEGFSSLVEKCSLKIEWICAISKARYILLRRRFYLVLLRNMF